MRKPYLCHLQLIFFNFGIKKEKLSALHHSVSLYVSGLLLLLLFFCMYVYNAITSFFWGGGDCSVIQIFSSTDEDELLRGAAMYSIYFVILAVGAGSVQFTGVSPCLFAGAHYQVGQQR